MSTFAALSPNHHLQVMPKSLRGFGAPEAGR